MIGVQEMLMQTIDRKIHLFPAWPEEWDVSFELHASYRTIVEVEYKAGNKPVIRVTPEKRMKDVVSEF